MKLVLGKDFPQTPPKAFFLTKIFHPNVASNGEICVNTLKKDWKPDLGLKHVLLVRFLDSHCLPKVFIRDSLDTIFTTQKSISVLNPNFLQSIQTIKCLLIVPNAESALNEEAGKMLLERYDDYSQRAKMMTEIHAQAASKANKDLSSHPECSESGQESNDGGPLSKKHATDKRAQDKKKEKLLKEKKRILKRL